MQNEIEESTLGHIASVPVPGRTASTSEIPFFIVPGKN